MKSGKPTLGKLRHKIENIDLQMQRLLLRRAELVARVRKYKKDHKIAFKDALREQQLDQSLGSKVKSASVRAELIGFHRKARLASHRISLLRNK